MFSFLLINKRHLSNKDVLELHLLFCSDVSSLLKGNTVFDAMRMRESIPRQIDKKFRVPKEEKGVWASRSGDWQSGILKEEKRTNVFFLCVPSVHFSSVAQSCSTLCDPMNSSMPRLPVHHQLLEFTQTHVHRAGDAIQPSSHLILCHPLLLLPPIPPSIRVFSNESALCIRWPNYWSFSFNISPSNEHPGLIFRMDWLDLLVVQGTLKSLLQHHSSKASILQHSAFFTVQLSHPYMTTGKTIALTR